MTEAALHQAQISKYLSLTLAMWLANNNRVQLLLRQRTAKLKTHISFSKIKIQEGT